MIRRPPRSTLSSSSAASDVYKRQVRNGTTINGTGSTILHKNRISTSTDRNSSMINIIGPASIPAHDTPFITACRNYANGCPCGLFTGGRTRCIPATNVMSGGNVSDCTGTSTSSFTATKYPSHSVSLTFISSTETPQPTASRRTTRSDTLLPSASASPLSSSASLTRTTSSSTSQSNTIASASRTSSPSFFINTSTRSQSSTATLSGTLSHRSPSITYTSTFTAAPPPTNTPCNYSCADVIALRQVSPSISTPQQAIDAYVPSRTTAPPQGCTALILPFTLTTKGAVTRVLIHINAPSTGLNTSHSLVGALLPTSQPAMQATVTASLSLIHISEPTRLLSISYAVFCLKKKTKKRKNRDSEI
eukprot:TRINITY_DN25233_c0_g1_i1.p1 TRINITY_DN25233_c0_g1~~TRINITY_DN25233_c0_g1_i1.p1  ORF type:complete len:363 (+),score=20.31 TRINITY_DN25233_c0_g1_i1:84-1172(+)